MSGDGTTLETLAVRFSLLSLLAVGGANALLPQLHAEAVVARHWLDDATFGELVAIAQAAPGPNLLILPLIGWHAAGWAGAFVSLAAFLVPTSTLAVVIARVLERHHDWAPLTALRGAFQNVGAGMFLAAGITLVSTVERGPLDIAVGVVAAALALAFDANPLWWLALGAVVGLVAG